MCLVWSAMHAPTYDFCVAAIGVCKQLVWLPLEFAQILYIRLGVMSIQPNGCML